MWESVPKSWPITSLLGWCQSALLPPVVQSLHHRDCTALFNVPAVQPAVCPVVTQQTGDRLKSHAAQYCVGRSSPLGVSHDGRKGLQPATDHLQGKSEHFRIQGKWWKLFVKNNIILGCKGDVSEIAIVQNDHLVVQPRGVSVCFTEKECVWTRVVCSLHLCHSKCKRLRYK